MLSQQTLIVVKPDGIAKGVVGEILLNLSLRDLIVTDSLRTQLPRELVEELYGNERQEIYFREVVDWVSSGTVLLLKVEGAQAVDEVKWRIIGRYPNGIRGKYSENWIKNVAHTPDSPSSAQRELKLVEDLFRESEIARQNRLAGKMVFALTGMSECGKSTVGKYLDSKGVKRLKIVKILGKVKENLTPGSSEDLSEFVKREETRDPYALWDAFIDELLREMGSLGANTASIESLYGGGLGPYLQQRLMDHLCIVYIDIPLEVRLRRQMIREGLSSMEQAKALLLPRDDIKAKSGIPALRDIAGEIIDNSGTLEGLHNAVDVLISRYRQA